MATSKARPKLSTTIAPENYAYLQELVERGRAKNIAEAVDEALEKVRALENRARLARDTAAYFERLTGKAAREEARLESEFSSLIDEINLDE